MYTIWQKNGIFSKRPKLAKQHSLDSIDQRRHVPDILAHSRTLAYIAYGKRGNLLTKGSDIQGTLNVERNTTPRLLELCELEENLGPVQVEKAWNL